MRKNGIFINIDYHYVIKHNGYKNVTNHPSGFLSGDPELSSYSNLFCRNREFGVDIRNIWCTKTPCFSKWDKELVEIYKYFDTVDEGFIKKASYPYLSFTISTYYETCTFSHTDEQQYKGWYTVIFENYPLEILGYKDAVKTLEKHNIHSEYSYDYPRLAMFIKEVTVESLTILMKKHHFLMKEEYKLRSEMCRDKQEYMVKCKQLSELPIK